MVHEFGALAYETEGPGRRAARRAHGQSARRTRLTRWRICSIKSRDFRLPGRHRHRRGTAVAMSGCVPRRRAAR